MGRENEKWTGRDNQRETEISTKRQEAKREREKQMAQKDRSETHLMWERQDPLLHPQLLLCSPTLTTTSLLPPVLNGNPGGLAGGGIGGQSLAKDVVGPTA